MERDKIITTVKVEVTLQASVLRNRDLHNEPERLRRLVEELIVDLENGYLGDPDDWHSFGLVETKVTEVNTREVTT